MHSEICFWLLTYLLTYLLPKSSGLCSARRPDPDLTDLNPRIHVFEPLFSHSPSFIMQTFYD